MSDIQRVQIKKDIFNWALRESQRDDVEITKEFPKINDWIEGNRNPTFKQLQNFANFLKIP